MNLFEVNEEVTLLRWGNFVIDKINKDENGVILNVEATYNPNATNFSKTKKASWLSVNVSWSREGSKKSIQTSICCFNCK